MNLRYVTYPASVLDTLLTTTVEEVCLNGMWTIRTLGDSVLVLVNSDLDRG